MFFPFGTCVVDREGKGRLFRTETAIPAGVIASVADDRITLDVTADPVKKHEPAAVGETGVAPAR